MKTILLAAGAAAVALTAGSAFAAVKKHPVMAGPAQPIPYSELNAYLKASPKQRASKDWWASASTGAGANASTTASATPSPDAAASASTTANPPSVAGEGKAPPPDASTTSPSTAVNPPASATPGAPEPSTPPK